MWKKLSIIGLLLLLITVSFSGCLEEESKPKLEISFDTDSSEFPVQLIVTSVDSDRSYNWSEINITLTSQFTEPIFLFKVGKIKLGDVIEIQDSFFDEVSKINVIISLHKSSLLIWGDTIYPPITTPNVSFLINESKMIVDSVDKIDHDWNFTLLIENETVYDTDQIYERFKFIEVGDTIDLYDYEIYETVDVKLIYNPTNDIIVNITLDLTEPDPEIYLLVHDISIDDQVAVTYFNIYSGKNFIGTKVINWEITADLPDWLTVSPMNGNFSYGTDRVNLSFSSTGLAAGEHNHTIKINSNYGNEEIEVTLTKE